MSGRYQFGSYCLDVAERRLTLHGRAVPLPAKTFELLQLLVERPGSLIEKDELLRKLWPDAFVEESNLAKQISLLRKTLENGLPGTAYIETVPKYGYRFLAEVSAFEPVPEIQVEAQTMGSLSSTEGQSVNRHSRKRAAWVMATALVGIAGMVIVAMGVRKLTESSSRASAPEFQLEGPLTDSGRVQDLAISPDGRYVAYLEREMQGIGIRLAQVLTHSDISIMTPAYHTFSGLTFSPDGSYVYFVRNDGDEGSPKSLYRIPTLGGPSMKVMDSVDSPVSFSPSGREFAYEVNAPNGEGMQVKVASIDGSNARILTTMGDVASLLVPYGPSWSPDGRLLALPVVRNGKPQGWALRTVTLADGNARDLLPSLTEIGRAGWLSDHEMLVQKNDANDHGQLWTISYPQGTARQSSRELADYQYPLSITQDGKTAAALVATGVVSNIWSAPAGAPEHGTQLTTGLPLFVVLHDPSGMPLAVSDDGQMWAIERDGKRGAIFPEFPMKNHVSRCADSLVFASYRDGETSILWAGADRSHPVVLAKGRLRSPSCSPDGKFVFYAETEKPQRILRVPAMGGAAVEIAKILGDGLGGKMTISPDGRLLAYCYRSFDGGSLAWNLAVLSTAQDKVIKTMKEPKILRGPNWTPDSSALNFLLARDGGRNIWQQSLQGKAPMQRTQFTDGQIFDFDWSQDGKRLLMARGNANTDVVILTRQSR